MSVHPQADAIRPRGVFATYSPIACLAAAILLCPPPAGPAIDPDASETTNVFCPSL